MLRLLVDADISPKVAREVRRHFAGCAITSLAEWENGSLLDQDDSVVLAAAAPHGLTLLTRDVSTIRPLLDVWAHEERLHAGVLFIDDRTVPEGNVGALVRAVAAFWLAHRDEVWENLWNYLPPAPEDFRLPHD